MFILVTSNLSVADAARMHDVIDMNARLKDVSFFLVVDSITDMKFPLNYTHFNVFIGQEYGKMIKPCKDILESYTRDQLRLFHLISGPITKDDIVPPYAELDAYESYIISALREASITPNNPNQRYYAQAPSDITLCDYLGTIITLLANPANHAAVLEALDRLEILGFSSNYRTYFTPRKHWLVNLAVTHVKIPLSRHLSSMGRTLLRYIND